MLWIVGTDEASLIDAAEACRTHAATVLEVALEASRQLEAGELGDGDRRTPALRIAELLATSRRLEVAADAFDSRRAATAAEVADLPPAPEPAAPSSSPRRRRSPRRTAPAPTDDAPAPSTTEDVTP